MYEPYIHHSAPLNDDLREITVTKTTKSREGSCNACNKQGYEIAYNIQFKYISFRVCKKCKEQLIKQLKEV